MTLVFLLMLAGTPVTDGLQITAETVADAGVQRRGAAQTELLKGPFKTSPLELGRPVLRRLFRLTALPQLEVSSSQVLADVSQGRSQQSGGLRIVSRGPIYRSWNPVSFPGLPTRSSATICLGARSRVSCSTRGGDEQRMQLTLGRHPYRKPVPPRAPRARRTGHHRS
jgi:hypothetical protein